MKRLISAESVRSEHAAGKKCIVVEPGTSIVTPEARSIAEQLGIAIVEQASGSAENKQEATVEAISSTAAATTTNDPLNVLRQAVMSRLPEGGASPELVDQLVRKVAKEQGIALEGNSAAISKPQISEDAGCQTATLSCGVKLVKGGSVRLGRFDGAGADSQVGIADVITADDNSTMAAGFMAWEKCFFPWTLNYDEVDVVLEGELHIRSGGQTVVAQVGDVIFIPKGSSIEFGTPTHVRFLYVAYPANWTEQ